MQRSRKLSIENTIKFGDTEIHKHITTAVDENHDAEELKGARKISDVLAEVGITYKKGMYVEAEVTEIELCEMDDVEFYKNSTRTEVK